MDMYLVTYDCYDYYCRGEHIRGLFDSKERAQYEADMLKEHGDIENAGVETFTVNVILELEV